LPSQLARLALILWCLAHPVETSERPVSEETMHAAIRVVEYFREHARRVFQEFRNADGSTAQPESRKSRLLGRVRRIFRDAQGATLSLSKIHEELENNYSSGEVREVLGELEASGEIERAPSPQGHRGRPAELWRACRHERNEENEETREGAA
jgi:hypothetical protein